LRVARALHTGDDMKRVLPALLLCLSACGEAIEHPHQLLSSGSRATTFTLHVTNQSFALDVVDIAVELDGRPAVRGDFEVGSQHTIHTFRFALEPGQHRLRAFTRRGGASLAETFTIDGEAHGALLFWYSPNAVGEPRTAYLSFGSSSEPITFE
jgi:hypothetical protein